MKKFYACLAGNWVCLNDDPGCVVGEDLLPLSVWWEEGSSIYAPGTRQSKDLNKFSGLDYVRIVYKGAEWRINPLYIQIATEHNYQ